MSESEKESDFVDNKVIEELDDQEQNIELLESDENIEN